MATYLQDFRRGDAKTIKIDFGAGCDITGWTFWFTLRENFEDEIPVAQVVHTPGDDTADDPQNGLCYVTLESDASLLIEPGDYYYDIQVSKGGVPPRIHTILPPIDDYRDKIRVVPGATQVSS